MKKIYSPAQVYISSFLGGPIALVYVLKKNFDVLGNKTGSKNTIILGSVFNVLLFSSLPFLSRVMHGQSVLLPIIYSVAARQIAEKYQLSKQALLNSKEYRFQSGWRVLWISLGLLVAFVVVYGVGLLILIRLQLF